jgi:hypothetical protein
MKTAHDVDGHSVGCGILIDLRGGTPQLLVNNFHSYWHHLLIHKMAKAGFLLPDKSIA